MLLLAGALLFTASGCCCFRPTSYGTAYAPPAYSTPPVYQAPAVVQAPAPQPQVVPTYVQQSSYVQPQAVCQPVVCQPVCNPCCM
jgi:hypothetical protein